MTAHFASNAHATCNAISKRCGALPCATGLTVQYVYSFQFSDTDAKANHLGARLDVEGAVEMGYITTSMTHPVTDLRRP